MKPLRLVTLSSAALLIAFGCFTGNTYAQEPAAPAQNLLAGISPLSSEAQWNGYSAISIIHGPTLFPLSSLNTVLYLGFTGGSEADISNMVLYSTSVYQSKIKAVTKVKLKGVSNPSIVLTDKKVCPSQPVSISTPCFIKLDPIKVSLSPTSDYYFVAYFTDNTNNQSVVVAVGIPPQKTSLTGTFEQLDDTGLTVGQSISFSDSGSPYLVVFVKNK